VFPQENLNNWHQRITFLPETPDMKRFFTTQSRSRPQSQVPSAEQRALEEQDIPPILQDGAGEDLNSSDYAKRCREIMDLYKDLRNLGYLFVQLVGDSCLTYSLSNSVCIPGLICPVLSLSGVNQVSARERFVLGWIFLITYTGGKSSLVEAVSCVSIWSCVVVAVASD